MSASWRELEYPCSPLKEGEGFRTQEKTGGASRVHVSPELIEVSGSGAPTSKWQQPFDAALTDVFHVQSDIASRAAQALGVALGAGEEKRLSEKPTQNLAAYDAYLKGEELLNSAGNAPLNRWRQALAFYEQAVALAPGFALAWARVSESNSYMYDTGASPELAARAKQAAEKAKALAPDRPEGYLALGQYQRLVASDFNRALEHFTRGLRLAPGSADLLHATGAAEISLSRWDAGIEHLRKAERLDPRSADTTALLGSWLNCLRRHQEAREALDRGLTLAPANLGLIEFKAMTFLAEGDLPQARAVLQAAPKEVKPTDLVALVADNWDLAWVLDEAQRELLLRLTPSAFDNIRAEWGLWLVQAHALKNDEASVRTYAEEVRKALEERLRATPDDAYSLALLGVALAHLSRKEEAMWEGERSVALKPVTKDAWGGAYNQHQLARIYILLGEPDKALDLLEPLSKIPYLLTPGWLKIDPNFDPLRKNPRFQRLVAGAK